MQQEEYRRIADAEDAHWWYLATRALMRQMLDPWLRPGIRVLDAGCGPGGNSAWLAEYGSVTGIDAEAEAVRLAGERHPEIEAREGDIGALPFADASFDVVLEVTVLNLVPDDALAVRELARVAAPGAAVLMIEPAVPWLHRDHDEVVMTRRRYRLADLRGLAEAAGLRVRRATCAYSFLLPPAMGLSAAHRLSRRERARSDLERDRLGRPLGALAAAERRLLRRSDLPLGLSALVLAEAPGR